jgi:acetoin utilization deacetylase AcuC-like enzyme
MLVVSGPDGSEASSSQGFCLLNSVAIAAAYARYNYRGLIERVAIVDFDVHYGDGTAAVVRNLVPGASVFVSIRQHTSVFVSIR